MATEKRMYDIVLFGASGYTGKYTTEQIARLAPTNLRWAVAGRSTAKLEAVVNEINSQDRIAPGIESCSLDAEELSGLAKKTSILINAVGPYLLYGEPVVRACVENGTHYIDVSVSFAEPPLGRHRRSIPNSPCPIAFGQSADWPKDVRTLDQS